MGHLGALVDKSLVQFGDAGSGPGRYRLLETVRQYAAGQLEALGTVIAGAARLAHRDYYVALAEQAAPHLVAAGQTQWLDRLNADLGNLRAALAFTVSVADPGPGLRMAAALRWYWKARGHAREGAGVLRALLDVPGAQAATLPRAQALAVAAFLLLNAGDYAAAGKCCEEGLATARAAGDERVVADLLFSLAWVRARQGQPGEALTLAESGLDMARRLGEPHLVADLLFARAAAAYRTGDHEGATRDVAESVRLFGQAGDRLYVAQMLSNLGYYEMMAGDLDAARGHLGEALHISHELSDRYGIMLQTLNLGVAEYLGGSPEAARALFAESFGLARRMGVKRQTAYALLGLALTDHHQIDPCWPVRLHGAADQALADLGVPPEPVEAQLAVQDRERLRAEVGDAAFEAEYAAGRALDLTQVLATLEGRTGTAASQAQAAGSGQSVTVLTPRELDVLRLVAQGLSNASIAQRLVLSEHTVHRHLANILRKLGLSSRAAAVAWGARAGLL
jgi:non-specific serine/threonine protein kinase